MDAKDLKRLFFALELEAAWPHPLPEGRLLKEEERHVTLAFLGNQSFSQLQKALMDFPLKGPVPGLAGICTKLLFLPKRFPHVVAGHVEWIDPIALQNIYQETSSWLARHNYPLDPREYHPHVTIARKPFRIRSWKDAFSPFPLIAKAINLYESVGNLQYQPVWRFPLIPPLEEIEHTADIGFKVRGKDIHQLFQHAQIALSFKFPELLRFMSEGQQLENLDDLIIQLNGIVSRADSEVGCPFKAISFHGNIKQDEGNGLIWEMIVDV